MPEYFVNFGTNDRGDHEVHREGCHAMPSYCTDLGYFTSCRDAVSRARTIYRQCNGCVHCSRECYTRMARV